MHINSTAEEFFFRCFAYQRNTPALDKTIIWSYNALGNRTEAREYAYTTATSPTGGTTTVFMHQNGWGNQVTIISQGTTTKTISYDNAGNPTNYKGATLTWTRGRLLASYKPSGSSYTTTMQYDANGVRCSKTIPTSTQPNVFRYVYDGNNLVRETKSGTSSYTKTFLYNSQGIVGFAIGSTVYTYRKNLFGDIIAIYQGATKKAAYVYDAWGNCTITQDTDGVGTANPFRYRSYYWDNDLQLYYLMSRYYDPATGRFINADGLEYLDPETIGGLNLYSYCGNNPVMYTDPSGTFWLTLGIMVAGGLINAAISAVASAISQGDDFDAAEFWIDIASGFVSGMVAASPLGFAGQVVASGVIGLGEYLAHSYLDEDATGPTWSGVFDAVAEGVVTTLVFGGNGANHKKSISKNIKSYSKGVKKALARNNKDYGKKIARKMTDAFMNDLGIATLKFTLDSLVESAISTVIAQLSK